jgi:cell division protein FtsL
VSAPARKLQERPVRPTSVRTKPAPTPSTEPAPTKTPIRSAPSVRTTAARPRPTSPPQPRVRARRGFHLAFWVFSASVISMIVVGIVALNAMVVNTTYRMETAQRSLDDLQEQQAALSIDVATLSAPSHIEEWAKSQWMVRPNPQNVVVLKVPGGGADR